MRPQRLSPWLAWTLLAGIALCWGGSVFVGYEQATKALTLAGLVLVLLSFHFRPLGVVGATMLCTLDPVSRYFVLSGGLFRWNTLAYALLIAAIVGWRGAGPLRELPSRILAGVVIILGAGLLWSLDPIEGALHILGALAYWGLLVLLSRGEAGSDLWSWSAVLCGAVAAGGMASLMVVHADLLWMINENALAYFPLTAILVATVAVSRGVGSAAQRLMITVFCSVNAGWVFLTGSRGSTLVALIVMAYVLWRLGGVSARLGFLAGTALTVTLAVGMFAQQQERMLWRFQKLWSNEYSLSGRTSGRSELMRAGWHLFLQNPALGIGTGAFATRWTRLTDAPGLSRFKLGVEMQAHSGWVKTLAENGVPGFAALAGFSVSFAAASRRLKGQRAWPFCLMISVVLVLALVTTEFQAKGLWMLAAAGSLEIRRARDRAATGRQSPGQHPSVAAPRHILGHA